MGMGEGGFLVIVVGYLENQQLSLSMIGLAMAFLSCVEGISNLLTGFLYQGHHEKKFIQTASLLLAVGCFLFVIQPEGLIDQPGDCHQCGWDWYPDSHDIYNCPAASTQEYQYRICRRIIYFVYCPGYGNWLTAGRGSDRHIRVPHRFCRLRNDYPGHLPCSVCSCPETRG